MSFISFTRVVCGVGFVLLLGSACGGQSSRGGGAGSGGSSPTAGGSNRAGTKATGGGSGTTAGAGGTVDREACTGPSDDNLDGSGCAAYFQRWTHDETTGICKPVAYGGCGATKNNYESLEACQKACHGANPNYDACQAPTDCVLRSSGCCGVCDGPSISAHDFIAYNKKYTAQVDPCVGDVLCGPCAPGDPATNQASNFVPNCVGGECVVEDIRESDVTACTTTDDCRLRYGNRCCEGCTGDGVIAVRRDASFEELVCGELIPPCAACDPGPLPNVTASCDATGHCGVRYFLD